MITQLSKWDFQEAFKKMGRDNNFSYEGLNALYDWLESCYEGMNEEYCLDVIALCCEFTEYENLEDFQNGYSDDYKTIEDIEDNTIVIMIDDDSFIIQDF